MVTSGTKQTLENIIAKHREALDQSFTPAQYEILESIAREILKALKAGNKILLCGNGGSAADSQHIAAEYVVRFKKDRKSLPAIALTTDTSVLTASSNDYDFNQAFARQIQGLANAGDILIVISTSGDSGNILEAAKQAKEQGVFTVGFTGGLGGRLKEIVDLCYIAQAAETPQIQEMHITALHAISEVVEEVFFGS